MKEQLLYLDQYGHRYWASSRKELVSKISPYGSPKVSIMYQDKKDGSVVRIGYIIGEFWCTAYKRVEIKV